MYLFIYLFLLRLCILKSFEHSLSLSQLYEDQWYKLFPAVWLAILMSHIAFAKHEGIWLVSTSKDEWKKENIGTYF